MKEIKERDLMEAYNKKYSPKMSLDNVRKHLETHAYYNMTPEFAADIMYKYLYK